MDQSFLSDLLNVATLKDEFAGLNFDQLVRIARSKYPQLIKKAQGETRDKDGRLLLRKRALLPLHHLRDDDTSPSLVNIMISVLLRGTYVRPHKHGGSESLDKNEYFYVVKGELLLVELDDDLTIIKRTKVDENNPVVHVKPGVWHSLVCVSKDLLMIEFKDGPYDPKVDKEFHPDSPAEEYTSNGIADECAAFMNGLLC